MRGANQGSLPMQRAVQMHQAGIVDSGTHFGAGIQDGADLVGKHGRRDVGILNGEGAAESAALIDAFQIHQVQFLYAPQQSQRNVAQVQAAQ